MVALCVSGGETRMIFRRAFRDSIPVLMGYSTMGFAAGVLLAVEGVLAWSPAWAAATSAAFVSGPLQYIFVDWVRTTMAIGAVLLVTLCVNFRYALYGLSLIERFRGARLWQKAYLIGTITDETYADPFAEGQKGKVDQRSVDQQKHYPVFRFIRDYWWLILIIVTAGIAASVLIRRRRKKATKKDV